MSHRRTTEFEIETGIQFGSAELLREAFVHSSYANEASPVESVRSDNERLEFLGDAVLEFVVSRYLYSAFPKMTEGELTRLRAALVRRETLARVAQKRRLGEFLVLGKGEEDSGGRERSATLCATYEAVVGALYLDQGLGAVDDFVMPDLSVELEQVQQRALGKDSKSRLQEWTQKEFGVAPRYRVVASEGPDHAKSFVIEVLIQGLRCGVGKGSSKQEASQAAATHALTMVGQGHGIDEGVPVDVANEWPVESDVLGQLYTVQVDRL